MQFERGFRGGFLVLTFVVFVVGFLTGMLAVALIPIGTDLTALGFMIFALGFVSGMLTIALVLMTVKTAELTKKTS